MKSGNKFKKITRGIYQEPRFKTIARNKNV